MEHATSKPSILRRVLCCLLSAVMAVAFVPLVPLSQPDSAEAATSSGKDGTPFKITDTDYGVVNESVEAKKLTLKDTDHVKVLNYDTSWSSGYLLVREDNARDGFYHLYLIGSQGLAHDFKNYDANNIDGITVTSAVRYTAENEDSNGRIALQKSPEGRVDNLYLVYDPSNQKKGIFNADTGEYFDYELDDLQSTYSSDYSTWTKDFGIFVAKKNGLYGLIDGHGNWLYRPRFTEILDNSNKYSALAYLEKDSKRYCAILTPTGSTASKDGTGAKLYRTGENETRPLGEGKYVQIWDYSKDGSRPAFSLMYAPTADIVSKDSGGYHAVDNGAVHGAVAADDGYYVPYEDSDNAVRACPYFDADHPYGVDLYSKFGNGGKTGGFEVMSGFCGGLRIKSWVNSVGSSDYTYRLVMTDEKLTVKSTKRWASSDRAPQSTEYVPVGYKDGITIESIPSRNSDDLMSIPQYEKLRATNGSSTWEGSFFEITGNVLTFRNGSKAKVSGDPLYNVIDVSTGNTVAQDVAQPDPKGTIVTLYRDGNARTEGKTAFYDTESKTFSDFVFANNGRNEFYRGTDSESVAVNGKTHTRLWCINGTFYNQNFEPVTILNDLARSNSPTVYVNPNRNTYTIVQGYTGNHETQGTVTILSFDPKTLQGTKVTSFTTREYRYGEFALASLYDAYNKNAGTYDLVNGLGEQVYDGSEDGDSSACDVTRDLALLRHGYGNNISILDASGSDLVSGEFENNYSWDWNFDYSGDRCAVFKAASEDNTYYLYDLSPVFEQGTGISGKVTENMLYTTKYCSYLQNPVFSKQIARALGYLSDPLFSQSDKDILKAAFKSNMSDISGAVNSMVLDALIKDEHGHTYTEQQLYETLAQEMLESMASVEDETSTEKLLKTCKDATGILDKVDKGAKVATMDDKTCEQLVRIAKKLTGYGDGMYLGPAEFLKSKEKREEFFGKADDYIKAADKTLTAIDLFVSYCLLWRIDMQNIETLMSYVPKNSGLYLGLDSLRSKMLHPLLTLSIDSSLKKLLEFCLDGEDLVTTFVNSKDLASGYLLIANLGYKFVSACLIDGPTIEDSNRAWLSYENALAMRDAIATYAQETIAQYNEGKCENPKTRKSKYKLLFSAFRAAMDATADNIDTRDEDSKEITSATGSYRAMRSGLSYKTFIHSCISNAEANWTYEISDGKATITGYEPGKSSKSSTWESYDLAIPSTVTSSDGAAYRVVSIGASVFSDTKVGSISIPDSVETIDSNALEGTDKLVSVYLPATLKGSELATGKDVQVTTDDKTVAENGLTVKNAGTVQVDDSGRLEILGLELEARYTDGTVEAVSSGYAAAVTDATHVTIAYGGAAVALEAKGLKLPYTIRYVDESGNDLHEAEIGYAVPGQEPKVQAPAIEDYSAGKVGAWTVEGATLSCTVSYTCTQKYLANATITAIPDQPYTGKAIKPEVSLTYKGTPLREGIDYEVSSYDDNEFGEESENESYRTGRYTATIYISGQGDYLGETAATFTIVHDPNAPCTPLVFSEMRTWANVADCTYTGKPCTPAVTVRHYGDELKEGRDFKVSYANNTEVGTATVTVTGIGYYSGQITGTFEIHAKSTEPSKPSKEHAEFKSAKLTKHFGEEAFTNALSRNSTGKVAYKSSKKSVARVSSKGEITICGVGKATITATVAGDSKVEATTCSCTLTVKAPATTSLKKLQSAKKALTVTWTGGKSYIGGYQLRYGTKKNMKGAKKLSVKGRGKTRASIKKLAKKKTYYVQIRTYAKANDKTIYSSWSKAKKAITK